MPAAALVPQQAAGLAGAASDAGNSVSFTNQHFTKTSGSSLRFSNA